MTTPSSAKSKSDLWWWSALLLAVLAILIINPVGFLGGGNDDWQYVNAANCWRAHGPCLPHDHWQARWPVIAPIALFTWLFGENRLAVSIGPLLASVSCLFLLTAIGNRVFGRPIGWLAALLLLLTPVFAIQIVQPSVEATELAFILAAAYAAVRWSERGGWQWSFLAGLSWALAFQVRETAIAAAILLGAYALWRRRPTAVEALAAALGGALPFAIEFIVFAVSTGDPFWRRTLALHHTLIKSSELLGPADPGHTPFFNKAYIANWKRGAGIHVHWTIDGFLNLFASSQTGLSLVFVPVLAAFGAATGSRRIAQQSLVLWAAGILYAAVLIYALAVDPKPRMMYPAFALTCTALALLTWALWRNGRALFAAALWAIQAGGTVAMLLAFPTFWKADTLAASWIRQFPNQIEADDNTRKQLQLVAEARGLPGLESNRSMLLYSSRFGCFDCERAAMDPGAFKLVRQFYFIRLHQVDRRLRGSLCLYAYNRPISGSQMRRAFKRTELVPGSK
jgi:hypothetical protein